MIQQRRPTRRTILVPLDRRPESERVLPLAAAIAARCQASLKLVHVRLPSEVEDHRDLLLVDDRCSLALRSSVNVYLDDLAERMRATHRIPVTAETVLGSSVASAVQQLCGGAVQLVIMARTRRSMLSRYWFGSPTNRLLCRLPVPLLVIGDSARAVDDVGGALFRRILAPLEGADSAPLLAQTMALANPVAAELRLLRVLPRRMAFGQDIWERSPGQRTSAGARTSAWRDLQNAQRTVRSKGLQASARVLFAESAGRAVLDQAAGFQADLIALQRRLHWWPGWAAGCVPEYVARHSASNLLIVPADQESVSLTGGPDVDLDSN